MQFFKIPSLIAFGLTYYITNLRHFPTNIKGNTCFLADLGGTPPPNYNWEFEGSPYEEAIPYQCRTNVTSATMLEQLIVICKAT